MKPPSVLHAGLLQAQVLHVPSPSYRHQQLLPAQHAPLAFALDRHFHNVVVDTNAISHDTGRSEDVGPALAQQPADAGA